MGVFGADVIHDVKQEISTIRWAVDRLRDKPGMDAGSPANLVEIDEAAEHDSACLISPPPNARWGRQAPRRS